jgi:hypothetical protein
MSLFENLINIIIYFNNINIKIFYNICEEMNYVLHF